MFVDFLDPTDAQTVRFVIHATALAPILNAQVPLKALTGDEADDNDAANANEPLEPQTLRVLIPNPDNDRLEPRVIPQLTGNHLCGTLRRLLLGDLLTRLQLTRDDVAQAAAHHETVRVLYHTLYSGGTLGIAPALIPAFTVALENQVRAEWPMFSALGASVGQAPMPAKVRFTPLLPATTTLAALFPDDLRAYLTATFDPEQALVRGTDDERVSGSRGADARIPYPAQLRNPKKKNPFRPMIVPPRGYIAPGTPLLGYLDALVPLTPVEAGLLAHGLNLLARRGRLGGWSHLGFGAAHITIQTTAPADAQDYLNWVAAEAPRLRAELTGERIPAWIDAAQAAAGADTPAPAAAAEEPSA